MDLHWIDAAIITSYACAMLGLGWYYSHRQNSDDDGPESNTTFPGEINASGPAGSVLVFDSRLWHSTASNKTDDPRVALAVRYAPWWLNLEVLRPQSDERKRMCDEAGASENTVPPIRRDVFEQLPSHVQPLYRDWIQR